MTTQKRDWQLILTIVGIGVAVVTGFPAVYDFVEKRFVAKPDSPQQELPKNAISKDSLF